MDYIYFTCKYGYSYVVKILQKINVARFVRTKMSNETFLIILNRMQGIFSDKSLNFFLDFYSLGNTP